MAYFNCDLKSGEKYFLKVEKFKQYAESINKEESTDLVLQYLIEKSKTFAASSLRTAMLNNYFKIEKKLKLNGCPLIINFLKLKEAKHLPKKS